MYQRLVFESSIGVFGVMRLAPGRATFEMYAPKNLTRSLSDNQAYRSMSASIRQLPKPSCLSYAACIFFVFQIRFDIEFNSSPAPLPLMSSEAKNRTNL
jgi:hypothetical protein